MPLVRAVSRPITPHQVCDEVRYEPPEPNFSPSPPTAHLTQELIGEVDIMPPPSHQPTRTRAIEDSDDESLSDVSRALVRDNEGRGHPHPPPSPRPSNVTSVRSQINHTAKSRRSETTSRGKDRRPPTSPIVSTPITTNKFASRLRGVTGPLPQALDSPTERSVTLSAEDTRPQEEAEEFDLNAFSTPDFPARSLRKRSLRQTNPFMFDKYEHNLTNKTGRAADAEDVEEAVQEDIQKTQTRLSSTKKSRTSTRSTKRKAKSSLPKQSSKRRRSDSVTSSLAPENHNEAIAFNPASVTLKVWRDGFPAAGAPTTLQACDDEDKLFDFMTKSWGWSFNDEFIRYAIISFPWLTESSNILLRPELKESFDKMVEEATKAPVWKKGAGASCEINITVYL
ncbi:hypothetical protein LTR47_002566 [Exophiala xenobiotica]|nr:hypothetical protein LTR47_002566 [Exophiala xenobiotica]